jgi:hypothetical protein
LTILHPFFHYLFVIDRPEIALSSLLLIVYTTLSLLLSHQVVAYLLKGDSLLLMMTNTHLTDFIVLLILGLDHFLRKNILLTNSLYNLKDLLWRHWGLINAFIFYVIWYFLLKAWFFLLSLQHENYPKLQLLALKLTLHYAVLLIVTGYSPLVLASYWYCTLYYQLFLLVIDEDHFLLEVSLEEAYRF